VNLSLSLSLNRNGVLLRYVFFVFYLSNIDTDNFEIIQMVMEKEPILKEIEEYESKRKKKKNSD